jgi:hypothetical protein
MAAVRSGMLRMNCNSCRQQPDLKKLYGCNGRSLRPADVETEGNVMTRYWNCPLQFVPSSIWEFIKIFIYHTEQFPSAPMPGYQDVNPKFLQACTYYKMKFAEFIALKGKQNG